MALRVLLRGAVGAALLGLGVGAAVAANPGVHLNDYGQVGLFQTPTARGMGSGTMALGYSNIDPFENFFLHVQLLDWLQASYRFTNTTNPSRATDPSRDDFTDKGADIQIRLLKESLWAPEVAVGLIDLGGTGLFSSEYLVASRRFFNLDVHVGLGWGRLGKRGDIGSPLGVVFDRFDERQEVPVEEIARDVAEGGRPSPRSWFTGDAAVFGGLVWTPRGGPLSLILELEGNDYKDERARINPDTGESNDPDARSRINLGVNYRWRNWADLSLSWQRGDQLGIQLATHTNFDRIRGPEKVFRPAATAMLSWQSTQRFPTSEPLDDAAVERIRRELDEQWVNVYAIDADTDAEVPTVTVWISHSLGEGMQRAGGRVARALIRHTGDYYDRYVVVEMVGGSESTRTEFPREAFHRAAAGDWAAEDFAEYVSLRPTRGGAWKRADYRDLLRYPAFTYSLVPNLRSSVGGPEKFGVTQLVARGSATMQLSPRFSVTGSASANIVNNFDGNLEIDFPSGLPRVRSDIRKFLRTGEDVFLSQLEANYLFPVAKDVYGRVSGGIFEDMYGGLASELLYRPSGKRWATGVEVARLRLRDFNQRFGFQSFETTTIQAAVYYEMPWQNLRLIVRGGRYLARDKGATVDLSKRFASGARFGVFASKTNVSSQTFGEGSFDKGFYVVIPFSLLSNRGGAGETTFSFRPLQRDGAQTALTGRSLYFTLDRTPARAALERPQEWLE